MGRIDQIKHKYSIYQMSNIMGKERPPKREKANRGEITTMKEEAKLLEGEALIEEDEVDVEGDAGEVVAEDREELLC